VIYGTFGSFTHPANLTSPSKARLASMREGAVLAHFSWHEKTLKAQKTREPAKLPNVMFLAKPGKARGGNASKCALKLAV